MVLWVDLLTLCSPSPDRGRLKSANNYPHTAKLNNQHFQPIEVVSRCRDAQLQVGEKYSRLFNLRLNFCKS